MEEFRATISDKNLLRYIKKSFVQKIKFYTVSFNLQPRELEIVIRNNRKASHMAEIEKIFFNIYDLMFLCIGRYPQLEKFNNKNTKDLVNKYFTSEHFNKSYFIFKEIDKDVICEKNIEKMQDFNEKSVSLYSLQYLVCKKYDEILWEHRFTLLLHIIDGFYNMFSIDLEKDKRDFVLEFKNCLKNQDVDKMGEYILKVYNLIKCCFYNFTDVSQSILQLLHRNNYTFLKTIEETRNWYSHLDTKEKKSGKINSLDRKSLSYLFIVVCALRQKILTDYFHINLNTSTVRESYACIHDWLLGETSDINDLFSNTYKLSFLLQKE